MSPAGSLAIIGGSAEPDANFPWVVGVQETRGCAGVLISPNWVLTAAHCVEGSTNYQGAQLFYSRTDPTTGAMTGITVSSGRNSVELHPLYKSLSSEHDLALIRFGGFNDPLVQPAALPTSPSVAGLQGTIAHAQDNDNPRTLPAGFVKVIRAPIAALGTNSFILGLPTASMCEGDSGSGFVVQGAQNVVVGIASQSNAESGLGGPCKAPPSEVTVTDVFSNLDWIRTTAGIHNGQVYATDGGGGIQLIKGHAWPSNWSLLIPGNFGGDGRTDVFFYDSVSGAGEFGRLSEPGNFQPLRQYAAQAGYDIIVPGDFGRTSPTDLLFYDREAGRGDFVTTDGNGNVTALRSHTNWRTSWDAIVPGQFGGDSRTDLLF
ncbi:MAG: S1 family peptidase, partial [Candidatus Binatia bacterium]